MTVTNTRKEILIKTFIVYGLMLCLGISIAFKIVKLKIYAKDEFEKKALQFQLKKEVITPERGSIFDCNGNLLATSLPLYDLIVDGKGDGFSNADTFNYYIDVTSKALSDLFKDRTPAEYKRILKDVRQQQKQWYLLKKNVSYNDMLKVQELPILRSGKKRLSLHKTEKYKRTKPFGSLASRTIGYYVKGQNPVGIDGTYNSYLEGSEGKRYLMKIARKTYIPVNSENNVNAENGKDIISTLDITLQDVAENSLMKMLDSNDADWGTVILMEVKTGEIRALANLRKDKNGKYVEDFNYAIRYKSNPGSTFKLVSMMALFEEGQTKPNTIVNAEGGKMFFCAGMQKPMEDSHLGHFEMTMQEAFEQSSNVAIAKQVKKIFGNNPDKLYEFYRQIGLTEPLGIDIAGEEKPYIKSPDHKTWSCTSLPYMSIGYELDITPMHIITIYNAVANNGAMVRPRLVKKITYNGSTVKEFKTSYINKKICSDKTVEYLKKLMEGVVLRGTARNFKISDYTYAGKTGTVKKIGSSKVDDNPEYSASFCGYFPADEPQFTCYVLINNPRKKKIYGAELALPVFKDIADKVFAQQISMHKDLRFAKHHAIDDLPLAAKAKTKDLKSIYNRLGISHHLHTDSVDEESGIWSYTYIQNHSVAVEPMLHKGQAVPDVTGMTAKDAVYLLESKGYKVQLTGKGKVIKQSVPAGSSVSKGSLIKLILT